MANKINILELDINTSALITKMTETRAAIDKLKKHKKELTNSNETNSDSFTKMKLKLKITNNIHFTKECCNTNSASDKFASSTDAITAALAKEITSISSVRQKQQLLSLRNELNLATVEGQTALGINVKLDENNAFIKENVSSYEQQNSYW
jgi:O-succinylbenzoate synthase